eukprot:9034494-Lingulodinium_polyedra.AAC.1
MQQGRLRLSCPPLLPCSMEQLLQEPAAGQRIARPRLAPAGLDAEATHRLLKLLAKQAFANSLQ